MDDKIIALEKDRSLLATEEMGLPTVIVPRQIIDETQKLLLGFSKGKERFEGVVYWAGKETDKGLLVMEAIPPRAFATPVSFRVSAEENARIMADLVKKNCRIIAQVSSRPGMDTTYSLFDEETGFLPYEGMITVIVGNYGLDGLLPLARNGVYVFHWGSFFRLTKEQTEKHFMLR